MDRAIEGGRDKAAEQGMRLVGAALEFGVELNSHEPGVNASRKLNYFNKLFVWRNACNA